MHSLTICALLAIERMGSPCARPWPRQDCRYRAEPRGVTRATVLPLSGLYDMVRGSPSWVRNVRMKGEIYAVPHT